MDEAFFGSGFTFDDANKTLVDALVRSNVQLDEDGVREAAFILAYGGEWGRRFIRSFLSLKAHQSPMATRRLVDALKAQARYEEDRRLRLMGEK